MRHPRRWLAGGALAAIVVVVAIARWPSARDDAVPIARAFDAGVAPSARALSAEAPRASSSGVVAHPTRTPAVPMARAEPGPHHAADPCAAVGEPVIPPGFETLTASGVTVAWSPDPPNPGPLDIPLRPIVLAYTVAGILDEAATFTGTPRRAQLTVIVYPSREDLLARTGVPTWADGLYDGAAVAIPARHLADLGVAISTVRHEVMHAQLHVAVGCMPSWLNEGLAMYFAGPPPLKEWIAMLRDPQPFDLQTLQAPAIDDAAPDRANRLYAQSLAMVVFVVEHSPLTGVKDALQLLPSARSELWERLYPHATYRTVLEALAQKLFGLPLGGELDALVKGSVCCYGLKVTSDVACRGANDKTSTPRAICDSRW